MIECRTEGGVERVVLSRPRANVMDHDMIDALRAHIEVLSSRPETKLVVFEGAGKHFSFGASVEEHLPDQIAEMLPGFHALFHDLEALGVPTAAIVRGQCLGGGAELATWCGRVFADGSAHVGFPEVVLGVFPPIAALSLGWRTGGRMATELVITGRVLGAEEAETAGLIDDLSSEPEQAMRRWYQDSLEPRSAHGLRHAWRAARAPVRRALESDLPLLESQYLDELMAHPDPTEGLTAFIERRPPRWVT